MNDNSANDTRPDDARNPDAPVREVVGTELMRAVRARQSGPWIRRHGRLAAFVAAVVVVAVPGGIAAAELLPEPEPLTIPAPAPLFTTERFASCPEPVKIEIVKLDSLSDYPATPGYPVEGCPTVNDLEQAGFEIGVRELSDNGQQDPANEELAPSRSGN